MSETITVELELNDDTMMTISAVVTFRERKVRETLRKTDGTAFANNDLIKLVVENDWSAVETVKKTEGGAK